MLAFDPFLLLASLAQPSFYIARSAGPIKPAHPFNDFFVYILARASNFLLFFLNVDR
jgi:hypothetical protein